MSSSGTVNGAARSESLPGDGEGSDLDARLALGWGGESVARHVRMLLIGNAMHKAEQAVKGGS